jgi:hypothetical protein
VVKIAGSTVKGSPAVAHDHVSDAGGEQDIGARHPGRARAGHNDRNILESLAHNLQGIEDARQYNDRGAVLVVVEDRDLQLVTQPALDLEAPRRRDVLKIDSTEGRLDRFDKTNDLLDIGRAEA